MARKQVERLRPSARLQAVARPVETYVRPAEQPVGKSDLGAFIEAISPGMEQLAQVEKQKQLKLQREAEQGIASARAFESKIAVANALRTAANDYRENETEYLNMSDEEVAARRSELMQPFIQDVENSGDDLLAKAVKSNIEIGNLTWFANSYDPAKYQYNFNTNMGKVGNELIAMTTDAGYIPQTEEDGTVEENLAIQKKNIDELVRQAASSYGYDQAKVNDYMMENVIFPRVKENGRDAAWQWANDRGLFGVTRYQKQVKIMENELDIRDKAILKAQEPAWFQQQTIEAVRKNMDTGNYGDLQIGTEKVGPAGGKQTDKPEDIVKAFEIVAQQDGLSRIAQMNWFRARGFVPTANRNAIMSGRNLWASGDLTDATQANAAVAAFRAVEELRAYNIDIPETLMTSEMEKRFKIISVLNRDVGMGKDIIEDIGIAQGANFDIKPSSKLKASVQSNLDKISPLSTDHSETINTVSNAYEIAETASILMNLGYNEQDAIDKASEIFEQDHVVHTLSNGLKISLKQLNTDPSQEVPLVEAVDTIISTLAQEPNLQNYLKQQYSGADDDNLGLGFSNDPYNRNSLTLSVYNGKGHRVGFIQNISKTQILTDKTFIPKLMAEVKSRIKEANLPEVAPAVPPSIADYEAAVAQMSPFEQQYQAQLQAARLGETVPTIIKEVFPEPEPVVPTVVETPAPAPADEMLSPDDMMLQGETAAAEVYQKVKDAVIGTYKQAPSEIIQNIQRALPLISASKEGVGTFFEGAYQDTKKKFSNLSAIKEARKILKDAPEIVDELGLNERGLFGAIASKRGITVKQQAEIARSIIAVTNASEEQYDVETQPQLDEALDIAVGLKGYSGQDIIDKIIMPIAYHESDGTLDPNLKQYGNGPARGLMQIEPASLKTYIQSTKNLFTKRLKQPVPAWIAELPADIADASELSGNQQKALFVYAMLQHRTADIAKVLSGEQSVRDFWLDNWWAGDDYAQRIDRAKAFDRSLAKYEKQS